MNIQDSYSINSNHPPPRGKTACTRTLDDPSPSVTGHLIKDAASVWRASTVRPAVG